MDHPVYGAKWRGGSEVNSGTKREEWVGVGTAKSSSIAGGIGVAIATECVISSSSFSLFIAPVEKDSLVVNIISPSV